ncbi:unnamed protein product, partial [Chrysoparadoxa australica]
MYKVLLINGICILLLSGCDKSLTFDVEVEEGKLVVFSIINPNEPVSVTVSRTLNPYVSGAYKNDSYIKDATVTVLENGSVFDELTYDEFHFIYLGDSSRIPTSGNEYQMVIVSPEFDEYISSPVIIPDTVKVDVQVLNTGLEGDFGFISEVTFTFQDVPNVKNAYGYDLSRDY